MSSADADKVSTFALLYARFRGSMFFVWALGLFCAVWITWNTRSFLPHFDDQGFPLLTLILSIEASLSVALLIMDTARQEARDRRQQKYMLDLMESVHDLLVAQNERDLTSIEIEKLRALISKLPGGSS